MDLQPTPFVDTRTPTIANTVDYGSRLLQQGVFAINRLTSYYAAVPFMVPVPAAATVYYAEVTSPMDLTTLERKLFGGSYSTWYAFELDLQLIWSNAFSFHRSTGAIAVKAGLLRSIYEQLRPFILDPSFRYVHHNIFVYFSF